MSRDELKDKAEPGGFVEYGKDQLDKIDSMRRDKSQPEFYGVPILRDEEVGFARAADIGNKPASCYTCKERTTDDTCERLGPSVLVKKVTGSRESGDPIEYWPCCSMHDYSGEEPTGKPEYHETLDTPKCLGLVWINAGKPGQAYGGANCGGINGGDDCDRYRVAKGEKWDSAQGLCTVLAHIVDAGDVCAAWRDDDILEWQEAQELMRGSKDSRETMMKRRFVRSLIGRSDADS